MVGHRRFRQDGGCFGGGRGYVGQSAIPRRSSLSVNYIPFILSPPGESVITKDAPGVDI